MIDREIERKHGAGELRNVLSALRRCGLCYSARIAHVHAVRTKANSDIGRHSAPGRGRLRACIK